MKKLKSINLRLIIGDNRYDDWAQKIRKEDPEVWNDLISGVANSNGAHYNGKYLDQLLRAIRNKCSHPIGNMTDEAKAKYPDHAFLSSYFTRKFPALALHLYLAFEYLKNDVQFESYYDKDFDWNQSSIPCMQKQLNADNR